MATTPKSAKEILSAAYVHADVFALRPDYRALLMVVEGIPPGPSDETSEALLSSAESLAKEALEKTLVTSIPHVDAWRQTYNAFGSKPKKFKPSVEALLRRASTGLPRVNRLTDIYNAISIKYQIPIGGEDLNKYSGAPFLIRAKGDEDFDTTVGGEKVVERPDVGEVVWCDEQGVTCRRWNWRQCGRTGLSGETTRVLFILDALDGCSDETLEAAGNELAETLKRLGEGVGVEKRIIKKESA